MKFVASESSVIFVAIPRADLEQYGRAVNRQLTFLMSWLPYVKFVWF